MDVHHLIVLLAAFSYFNLGFVYAYKYFNPEEQQYPTALYQAEAQIMNNVSLKPEMKMENKFYNAETEAGQSKSATFTKAKGAVEVH